MKILLLKRYYHYILNIIISTVIVLIGMIIIKSQMPPRIVKVDLVAITTHYSQIMLAQTMNKTSSEDSIKQISETIKTNLEPLLADYAKRNNAVIIQAQALVDTNTLDITNDIIEELDQKLK